MLSLGLTTDFRQFLHQVASPGATLVGLLAQLCLVPLLALLVVLLLDLPPALAAGLMILSFCPGGVTSNWFSHMARGNVPLSISLTRAADHHDLRRRVAEQTGQCAALRGRHCGGLPRSARRPDAAEAGPPRPRHHDGARRGRPYGRFGFPARRHPNPGGNTCRRPAAAVFGHLWTTASTSWSGVSCT